MERGRIRSIQLRATLAETMLLFLSLRGYARPSQMPARIQLSPAFRGLPAYQTIIKN
jgi:hypothetical protein